jgi:hypothetical protein
MTALRTYVQATTMLMSGALTRLLWTVQCFTTARSAGMRSTGKPAGGCTTAWIIATRAGRSVAMVNVGGHGERCLHP